MLVLAVAGGAWALFGRSDDKGTKDTTRAAGTTSSSPTLPVFGPRAPGTTPKPSVTATSTTPVAAGPTAAATKSSTAAPAAAPATKAPTAGPVSTPVARPPVTAPQVGGTVATKAYTFKVARGDTLWGFARKALAATGRSTSNANVAAFVGKLYESNKAAIGSNPDLILPGQTIVWPAGM